MSLKGRSTVAVASNGGRKSTAVPFLPPFYLDTDTDRDNYLALASELGFGAIVTDITEGYSACIRG